MENTANGWLRAIDEEMVCAHLGIADASDSYEVAKENLNKLIAWYVAIATDPAVNGGYALVPLKPTDHMTWVGQSMRHDKEISIASIYRAMLSAAPKP